MKTKRERIEYLLDHWTDIWETLNQPSHDHAGEVDGAVTLMPRMTHHPSVRELENAIRRTRQLMPVQTAHLMAYYTAEWRNTDELTIRRTKKGKRETVTNRVRRRIIPAWVRNNKVEHALLRVIHEYRGEVFIPDELLEAAA